MPTMEITTVSSCKNACAYCPQALLKKSYNADKYMSLETFQKCVDKIPKDVTIDFAGYVEPFLNPQCMNMIEYAVEAGYEVRIFTTLVGITLTDVERLSKLKIAEIVLHLPDNDNVMKAGIDDKYVKVAKEFDRTVKYKSAHVFGTLHHKLRPIFPFCIDKPSTHLHSRANNLSEKVECKRHDYVRGIIMCGVIQRHSVTKYGIRFNHNVLLPDGSVGLCCMDYGQQHQIGNLVLEDYEDLFKSKAYERVMRGLHDEQESILCRTCKETVKV
jgi:sulfatase maturation enzyme AslB (radical SAM superfamily)